MSESREQRELSAKITDLIQRFYIDTGLRLLYLDAEWMHIHTPTDGRRHVLKSLAMKMDGDHRAATVVGNAPRGEPGQEPQSPALPFGDEQ